MLGGIMNCKQGDLAVVIKSNFEPKYIGSIVKCVQLSNSFDEPGWIVEPQLGNWGEIADGILRPIRPNEGEDETLTWAGKPHKETA
jgi:hypothetical protein